MHEENQVQNMELGLHIILVELKLKMQLLSPAIP